MLLSAKRETQFQRKQNWKKNAATVVGNLVNCLWHVADRLPVQCSHLSYLENGAGQKTQVTLVDVSIKALTSADHLGIVEFNNHHISCLATYEQTSMLAIAIAHLIRHQKFFLI